MNIVISGPPGSGKGTQAGAIVASKQVVHISTGDMLRAAVRGKSKIGRRVESVMAAGEFVSDELMMDIIEHRLEMDDAQDGWLLDGLPRTVVQAERLMELLPTIGQAINAVVVLDLEHDELLRRLCGRLTCRECQGVSNRDQVTADAPDRCPNCGKDALYQRRDDLRTTIEHRLGLFSGQTLPAAEKLGEKYDLLKIDALGTPDEVAQRIAGVLE